jgi:PAS domain S-box-containing protein
MASPRHIGFRRLNSLLRRAREPVFLLNADLRLSFVNRAWEQLTGYTIEAVMDLECRPPGPPHDGDLDGLGGSFCPPPEALAGRPAGVRALVVHPGGERRWCRVEFWPYHDDWGALIGFIGLVRPADAPAHAPDSESQRLRAELAEVRQRLRGRYGFDALVGRGPGHRRLLDQVAAAAATDVPALIVGEPGTGKRTVARTIHQQGARAQSLLMPLDCAALPPDILERELFGGPGVAAGSPLDLPDGVTVLLAEVQELPRDLQGRLATALDGRVRLLATTTADPDQARRDDRLRADLYYALTTLVIRLAPLRERLDELPLLAQSFLEQANRDSERRRAGFAAEGLAALVAYDWPGNLRELARVVAAAHDAAQGDLVELKDIPATIRGHLGAAYTPPPLPPPITPLDDLLAQVERRLIEQALQRAGQNKSRAATLLQISRPRLHRRIKELNIPDEPEPAAEPSNGQS